MPSRRPHFGEPLWRLLGPIKGPQEGLAISGGPKLRVDGSQDPDPEARVALPAAAPTAQLRERRVGPRPLLGAAAHTTERFRCARKRAGPRDALPGECLTGVGAAAGAQSARRRRCSSPEPTSLAIEQSTREQRPRSPRQQQRHQIQLAPLTSCRPSSHSSPDRNWSARRQTAPGNSCPSGVGRSVSGSVNQSVERGGC